jgi:hypothetical protein
VTKRRVALQETRQQQHQLQVVMLPVSAVRKHRAARESEKTVRSRLRVAVTNAFWARKNAYLFRFLRAAREPSALVVPVRAVSRAREKQ